MTDSLAIHPRGPLAATIRPPGSKSLTNRALVCAALAKGSSVLSGALDSEDTQVMVDALVKLGVQVVPDRAHGSIGVEGCGGRIPAKTAELFLANSGTSMRFLAASVALGRGKYRLDGTARMRERPIEDLLAALAQLGVDAKSETGNGCPPVVVNANGLSGGKATVRGDVSSQFLSGLLLAAPYAAKPVALAVDGVLVSQPYVRMTLAVMKDFFVPVAADQLTSIHVPQGCYQGRVYKIEPDASAASYFFAAAAIAGGKVTVQGLSKNSLQGDVAFVELLARMGCRVDYCDDSISVAGGPLVGIDCEMNAISDTVQTLAAVALFAEGKTTVRGVAHVRHKETDRLAALATELRKLGAAVEELPDGLVIEPKPLRPAAIDTYKDHRMAMSLALVGLMVPGLRINDPGCTAKTYPAFFRDLESLAGA